MEGFNCRECDKKFDLVDKLKIHIVNHMHKCRCYNKFSSSKASLLDQIVIHSDKLLPCAKCEFTAKRRQYLSQHIRSKHNDILNKCEFCDYTALTQAQSNLHVQLKYESYNKQTIF